MRLGSPEAMRWDGDLDPPSEDVDEQAGMPEAERRALLECWAETQREYREEDDL